MVWTIFLVRGGDSLSLFSCEEMVIFRLGKCEFDLEEMHQGGNLRA